MCRPRSGLQLRLRREAAPRALAAHPTWTVREAAQPLGISKRLLWNRIRDRRLPVLRLGRRTLVRSATVEQVLADAARA
jgi:excisionase family DNA binding protein